MKNRISADRNRVYSTSISLFDDDGIYVLQSGERLIFGVKLNPDDSEYIINKEVTASDYSSENHSYVLTLTSSETDIDAGVYYYDIALRYPSGELEKVIGCNEFIILDSVVRSRIANA